MRMKPVRGSRRTSSQAPGGRKCNRKGLTAAQEAGPSGRSTQGQKEALSKNRDARGRKENRQEMWKPLPKNSIMALENVLSVSILSVLTIKQKNKEESQKHLNILKDRFVASCAQLKVPPRKHGSILQGSRVHHIETKKAALGKQNLGTLEVSVSKVVSALKEVEGKMEAEEQENMRLKSRLEEEEHSHQFPNLPHHDVLHFPSLHLRPGEEPTLQEQLAGDVTDTRLAASLVQEVCSTMKVQEVQDVQAFLELAHRQADGLQWSRVPAQEAHTTLGTQETHTCTFRVQNTLPR